MTAFRKSRELKNWMLDQPVKKRVARALGFSSESFVRSIKKVFLIFLKYTEKPF